MSHIRFFAMIGLITSLTTPALAQQWTPIGQTVRDSNALFIRTSSVKRAGDTVTALLLTRFKRATFDPQKKDSLRALTTLATIDCKLEKVKILESVYYVNFDRSTISSRSKPKIPGWGGIYGAAYPLVFKHLCGRAAK